ncbi:MAG TPA: flagellar basal body rod protein FlgB [Deltaproteobacteria bacterium]|nr:flagellar basal body rod protein FlgB [Deltaproteobacteria bacterium]HQB39949.1 flagellar basal body rod protein FlgB [Deltaproteobacteria bacterium]
MPVDGIFSSTINLLSKSIDLRVKSQNLISSNVANAETPNYVPKSLDFEHELQGALKGGGINGGVTNSRHIPLKGVAGRLESVSGRVVESPSKSPGKDGNAVEIENEMSRMAENQIMYNATVQMLTKKLEGLRSAMKVGS